MHTLHVYALRHEDDQSEYLTIVRAIRAARVVAGIPGSMAAAAAVIDTAEQKGYALVCQVDSHERISKAADAARSETTVAKFAIDKEDEWFAARARAEAGLTPEQSIAAHAANEAAGVTDDDDDTAWDIEVTETALVMLAAAAGNPAAAALLSNRLRATTGDDELYRDVTACLLRTFRTLGEAEGEDG